MGAGHQNNDITYVLPPYACVWFSEVIKAKQLTALIKNTLILGLHVFL